MSLASRKMTQSTPASVNVKMGNTELPSVLSSVVVSAKPQTASTLYLFSSGLRMYYVSRASGYQWG